MKRINQRFRIAFVVLLTIFSLSSTMVPTTALDLGAKAAIETDLRNSIRKGDKKLSSFAQQAINSTRG